MTEEAFDIASHWDDILVDELNKESDRAAVILTVSIFDDALARLLKAHLVPCPTSSDDLFDSPGAPLTTFSARINFAHRIGLISSRFSRDLHLIRRIRNDFSHNIHGCDFGSSAVISRVMELSRSSGIIDRFPKKRSCFEDGPRGDFLTICTWMLWHLTVIIEITERTEEPRLEWGYDREQSEEAIAARSKSEDS